MLGDSLEPLRATDPVTGEVHELARPRYFIESAPGTVRWRRERPRLPSSLVQGTQGRAVRGVIVEFTERSRREMRYKILSVDWGTVGPRMGLVTFTYGVEWPMNGPQCKAQLARWSREWDRRWEKRLQGVWDFEFQARGAPHFAFYMGLPEAPLDEFEAWARQVWHKIAGAGYMPHAERGLHIEPSYFDSAKANARRIGGYFFKEFGKDGVLHYQKIVPEGFEHPGRFWSLHGVKPRIRRVEVDRDTFHATHRPGRRLRQVYAPSGKVSFKVGDGFWTESEGGDATLDRLLVWAAEGARERSDRADADF